MPSAGMQSWSEQHSFGYQEWAFAVCAQAKAAATSTAHEKMQKRIIEVFPALLGRLGLCQLCAGTNRQMGTAKVLLSSSPATTRKQMWTRPSGADPAARPAGIQIRRAPTTTILSPRASVVMRSAGTQSRLEQHSFGYQE